MPNPWLFYIRHERRMGQDHSRFVHEYGILIYFYFSIQAVRSLIHKSLSNTFHVRVTLNGSVLGSSYNHMPKPIRVLRFQWGSGPRHLMYTADPWHCVVIHKHSTTWCPKRSKRELVEPKHKQYFFQLGGVQSIVAWQCLIQPLQWAIRYLIPKCFPDEKLKAKGSISICLAFDNRKHALRLIHHTGRCVHTW